jgi:hypothetical protein
MAEFNGAVSEEEEEKIVVITKIISISWSKMTTRIHRRKILKVGHDLLYWAWPDRSLVHIVYINSCNNM